MKRLVAYALVGLVGLLLLRWIIGVIFSRPKQDTIRIRKETATTQPTRPAERGKAEAEEVSINMGKMQASVFEDEDESRMRGFGEQGLDWVVHYEYVHEGVEKSGQLEARADRKCFPSIFNWLYGGCTEVIKVPLGDWVRVYIQPKPGWKVTNGQETIKVVKGKNLVFLGARRLLPGEKVEAASKEEELMCQELEVKKVRSDEQNVWLRVQVQAKSGGQGTLYNVKVNDKDLGWSPESTREVQLKKGQEYVIAGYVKGTDGRLAGGNEKCRVKVNGELKVQPETGIPTWVGLVILLGFPIVGWRLVGAKVSNK
ncbi:MAG: hypothetical protein GXP43_01745 [bacterium]|nr:hypothetical protein [bacterium]